MAAERSHHPYSPSSLQFLEACPCWVSHNKVNERAIAGTLAHSVAESRVDDDRLSDDDAGNVAECVDFFERSKILFIEERNREIKRIAEGLPNQADLSSGCDYGVPEVIELSEVYLPIDHCKFEDAQATTAGYVDKALISWDRKRAEMFDWKFGAWPVEDADNNLQGMAYALGLWLKYPSLEKIRFVFKQPLIQSVTEATWTRKDIAKHYLRIQAVVAKAREARTKKDFALAVPRVPACNFCGNIGACPKVCDFACKVGSKFWPLEIPASITPSEVHNPKDTTLGLRLSSVLKVWCDAFRSRVTDRVIADPTKPPPPGYVLQDRRDREILDKKLFKKTALQFITEAELDEAITYTFGPIEDLISEKAPRGTKKHRIEEFQRVCEESKAVQKGEPYFFLRAVATKASQE